MPMMKTAAVSLAILGVAAPGNAGAQQVQRPADPNEKVCQVTTPVGSRLATKKTCLTRAEWEDRKRQDREATERAQTQLCVINPMTGKC